MDFRNLLGKLNQLNEGVEVVAEKAVSQAQQKAAGAALAAKRGDIPKSELTGASKEMLDMSEKDLEDFAGTKHKGIPKKKTDESFDADTFRKSFEAMVEAKSKPDFLDVDKDGDKKEPMKKAAKDAKGDDNDKSENKGMSDKQKKFFGKKDESIEEGSISRKLMKALTFGPQTDSPKDMQDGIRKMSDKELLDLMRGDDVEAPSGSARSLQQKLLKRELRRRGIGESVEEGMMMAGHHMKTLKCKACGDMLGNPTTDCPHDSHDHRGSNWMMVDIDRDGDADIAIAREGKSPHKKGSKKYKDQMAAKHASMNESFEKFINNEKLTFEEAVKIVRESGGQQEIDPVDTALWNWAQRVAANKFTENRKAEMYAGLIYERNGGEFQLHDVLSESTIKKPEGINEDVSTFVDAGIPKEYAEQFLKKYQVKHDAKISPTDGVPKASDIRRDSFIINVLPNGDVRGFGKKGDDWKVGKNFYSVLHMVDGKFTDTGYESLSAAKQGMSKQGKFYTLDGNMWSFYRDKKPDSGRDTRGDVMTGDGNIYGYMNDTFMTKMRPMMEKMVDDIYANLRKLDNKNKTYYSPSDQERALEAAQTIEAIAERGFNRATMENFLTHLKRVSYGFRSIPANERELRKILKDTPNARAKWAKTVLDAAKRQHERVKQMLYGPTVNALKGEPENA